jgi:hypothetical protein
MAVAGSPRTAAAVGGARIHEAGDCTERGPPIKGAYTGLGVVPVPSPGRPVDSCTDGHPWRARTYALVRASPA